MWTYTCTPDPWVLSPILKREKKIVQRSYLFSGRELGSNSQGRNWNQETCRRPPCTCATKNIKTALQLKLASYRKKSPSTIKWSKLRRLASLKWCSMNQAQINWASALTHCSTRSIGFSSQAQFNRELMWTSSPVPISISVVNWLGFSISKFPLSI